MVASRRRSGPYRRRRWTAALVAVGLVAALAAAAWSVRGPDGPEARAQGAAPATTGVDPATTSAPATAGSTGETGEDPTGIAETAAPDVPKRLGSGQPVTFAFGGDVMFEEPIRSYLDEPASVFAPVALILRRADIAMVNLETAVTDGGDPTPNKEYLFRAPASAFDAIRAGGIDVVTVANNHGMDYGASGLRDTLRHARRAGVPVVGGGRSEREAFRPWRTEVNGQRIAVIGASQVIDEEFLSWWQADGAQTGVASAKYEMEERLLYEVRRARRTSDTVVVYLHWGAELEACPLDRQVTLARSLVRAGADIIVGSHAHILLGGGMLGRAFVDYGLGNFVFYTGGGVAARTGVLEVTATGRRIDGYRWRPAEIEGGRPVPLTGAARTAAIADWRALRGCTGLQG
ncbi:MAG: CapA family protein [Actinomycetota bacterium]